MPMTEKMKARAIKLQQGLRHCIGSERFYRHALARRVCFTDGVKFLADTAESYWLIDKVALQCELTPALKAEWMQQWTLTVTDDGVHRRAELVATGAAGELHREQLDYTDFPLNSITLMVGVAEVDDEDQVTMRTICLPSEN